MLARLVIAATLVLIGAGCSSDPSRGYSFSSTHDRDVQTVHVPIFKNDTYSHDLEMLLTDALIKEIRSATRWKVTGATNAQTTLRGEITDVALRKLSTARTSGLAQELAVGMTLDFEFVDNRTGDVIMSRRNFTGSETFVPSRGLNERIEFGENAVIQELARDVVGELRSNW